MPLMFRARSAVFLLLTLLLAVALPPAAKSSVTTELLVLDRHSGLALYGYDPVSYFIERAAHAGIARFEITYGGLSWRFRNEANRAAFIAQPDFYVPKFGGYDPLGVVRGVPVPGHPTVFAIYRNELFLFSSEESREEFLRRPDPFLQAAKIAWPAVRRSLVP